MTGWQEAAARLISSGENSDDGSGGAEPGDPWQQASAPAKLAKRVIEGVFQKQVSPERIPLLTNVMHWSYGTGWGAVYGLIAGSLSDLPPLRSGLLFGSGVWAMSYVQLVPLGLYELPWKYPLSELALDLSYHLAYGSGVGIAYAVAP